VKDANRAAARETLSVSFVIPGAGRPSDERAIVAAKAVLRPAANVDRVGRGFARRIASISLWRDPQRG
jgi:hypothetical protein